MKLLYFFTFLVLVLTGCGSKCDCNEQNTTDMINDRTLTDKFECLDIDKLKEIAEMSVNEHYTDYWYQEYYSNGLLTFHISGDQKNGFTQYFSLDTINYLSFHKRFYPDGRVKQKGIWCDLGFRVGKWYQFDEDGDLIEVTDEGKDHQFTFSQLREAVKEEGLSLDNLPAKNGSNSLEYPVRVTCGISEIDGNIPVWNVTYKDPENREEGIFGTIIQLTYDGRTGELIKKDISALNP